MSGLKVKGCEYIRNTYNVPACIGRQIEYNGRHGILSADRGNYIGVTFDDEPATTISNFHPLEKGLVYGGIGNVRKMTRSQARYKKYLEVSECYENFKHFLLCCSQL